MSELESGGISEGALPPELGATPPAQSPTIGEIPKAAAAAVAAEAAAPKGPTAAEKHEAALAKQKEKWDKLIAESNSQGSDEEIPAASEPAAADAGGKGTAADGTEPDTTDDAADRRQLAADYGVSVEQLAGFATATEAAQALRQWDLDFFSGRGQQTPPPKEPAGSDSQPTAEQRQLAKKLNFDLTEWEENESVRKNFELIETAIAERDSKLDSALERLQSLEAAAAHRELTQRVHTFHSTLDALDPERFGKAESLTDDQRIAREWIGNKIESIIAKFEADGIEPPQDVAAFTRRVYRALLGAPKTANNARAAEEPKSTPAQPRPQLGPPGRSQPRSKLPGRKVSDLKTPEQVDEFLEETFNHLAEKSASGY